MPVDDTAAAYVNQETGVVWIEIPTTDFETHLLARFHPAEVPDDPKNLWIWPRPSSVR
jgi:hypothetical protein